LKFNKSVLKSRTKGLFTDSIDTVLKDPGSRYHEEKASLLNANPELLRLLERKEQIERRKLVEKKESKILLDIEVKNQMRIRDRKAYKTFVKNPALA